MRRYMAPLNLDLSFNNNNDDGVDRIRALAEIGKTIEDYAEDPQNKPDTEREIERTYTDRNSKFEVKYFDSHNPPQAQLLKTDSAKFNLKLDLGQQDQARASYDRNGDLKRLISTHRLKVPTADEIEELLTDYVNISQQEITNYEAIKPGQANHPVSDEDLSYAFLAYYLLKKCR